MLTLFQGHFRVPLTDAEMVRAFGRHPADAVLFGLLYGQSHAGSCNLKFK